MRYSHDTMLPERAFRTLGGKLISLEGGGGGKAPAPQAQAEPVKQEIKQPEKLPEAEVVRAQNQNRMAAGGEDAGYGSTLLTEPGGVDMASLEVDKNKLTGKNNLLGA